MKPFVQVRYTPHWWQVYQSGKEILFSDAFSREQAQTLFDDLATELMKLAPDQPTWILEIPRSFSPEIRSVAIYTVSSPTKIQTQIIPHALGIH